MGEVKLPVHGFVLAGGKSSRMGVDKALLPFLGRPMVEIAVEKLREFCEDVSIVGNREDLAGFAEVVREERVDVGPGAGIEAGLKAARREWVLFVPVDVPLVPAGLLRGWVEAVLERGAAASFLKGQPAFCLMKREGAEAVSAALERGERRVAALVGQCGDVWVCDAADLGDVGGGFLNVNTPEDLAGAEAWASVEPGSENPDPGHPV